VGKSKKDKLYKTNPHRLEELRNNIRREILTISGQDSKQRLPQLY
jgi:hypothetical protein